MNKRGSSITIICFCTRSSIRSTHPWKPWRSVRIQDYESRMSSPSKPGRPRPRGKRTATLAGSYVNRKRLGWLRRCRGAIGVAAMSSLLTYAMTRGGKQSVEVAHDASAIRDGRGPYHRNSQLLVVRSRKESRFRFASRLRPATGSDEGLVEITFNDGAVVVLEGPATFNVHSPGKAQLHRRAAGRGRAGAGPWFSK